MRYTVVKQCCWSHLEFNSDVPLRRQRRYTYHDVQWAVEWHLDVGFSSCIKHFSGGLMYAWTRPGLGTLRQIVYWLVKFDTQYWYLICDILWLISVTFWIIYAFLTYTLICISLTIFEINVSGKMFKSHTCDLLVDVHDIFELHSQFDDHLIFYARHRKATNLALWCHA